MIYDFLNDRTSAILVNFFLTLSPDCKFISYEDIQTPTEGLKNNRQRKVFKIGFDGNSIEVVIYKNDDMLISKDGRVPSSGTYHQYFNVHPIKTQNDLKIYTIQSIRDHKINTIL